MPTSNGIRRLCGGMSVIVIAGGLTLAGCNRTASEPEPQLVNETGSLDGSVDLGEPAESLPADLVAAKSTGDDSGPALRRPLQLGGPQEEPEPQPEPLSEEQQRESVVAALDDLQVLLGQWRGTTRSSRGDGFKALDEPLWVWDFQTIPGQPALVMTSASSPYIREARLTYDLEAGEYQLTATDADGQTRVYTGTFTEPVRNDPGDDDKPQRTFKLELTEAEPLDENEQYRVVFNQQENNRYLLELYRKRGEGNFIRQDTVSTQRQGTSFAFNDPDDFGDKTCVISQGLGVMQVSHDGQSFWVCCSGCKAAFEDDPEKWIARFKAKQENSDE